jgi:hypothetical protein
MPVDSARYWATIPVTESTVPLVPENWTHIPPESVAHLLAESPAHSSPESVAHFDRNTQLHPALPQSVVRSISKATSRMNLTLDHSQRLNLHAHLGALRAGVGSIRGIWAIQNRLALDVDEE